MLISILYNKDTNTNLVTSFNVSENKIYVVRVVDTSNNVSYKTVKIWGHQSLITKMIKEFVCLFSLKI